MATDLKTPLISEQARSFMTATPRYTTLASINPDGSPHQIVIWFLLRHDERGDVIVVNSRHGRRWPSNLRRDGRVSVCVFEAEDAVTIDCIVERSYEGDDAQDDIAEMARRYDTPEMAERETARFRTEPRLSFVLRPTRVRIHGNPT